jgi:hypothetical protein
MTIERSTGIPVTSGGVSVIVGGGYRGVTEELDAVIREAACALAGAYGADIEIRFNTDRESGGAWLKTPDGRNDRTGICAALVTARARASWERHAAEAEREAATGRASWQAEPLTSRQRAGARESAAEWRATLAANPEGQLTVFAFIDSAAAGDRWRELSRLDGWNAQTGSMSGYHYGAAESVAEALARCLQFASPRASATADAAHE